MKRTPITRAALEVEVDVMHPDSVPSIVRHIRGDSTQELMAMLSGVDQSTVSRIESGDMDPTYKTLHRILRAAGYDVVIVPLAGTYKKITRREV
jgi:transcriptional regulator with XRE-family HTH domain